MARNVEDKNGEMQHFALQSWVKKCNAMSILNSSVKSIAAIVAFLARSSRAILVSCIAIAIRSALFDIVEQLVL